MIRIEHCINEGALCQNNFDNMKETDSKYPAKNELWFDELINLWDTHFLRNKYFSPALWKMSICLQCKHWLTTIERNKKNTIFFLRAYSSFRYYKALWKYFHFEVCVRKKKYITVVVSQHLNLISITAVSLFRLCFPNRDSIFLRGHGYLLQISGDI